MGQDQSRAWGSFGEELLEIHSALYVSPENPTAVHRYAVVQSFLTEYVLHNVRERFRQRPEFQGVTFSMIKAGSWLHGTKVREANEFDLMLSMEYAECAVSLRDAATNTYSVLLKQQPAARNPFGSLRNVPVNRDAVWSDFPVQIVFDGLYEIVDNFWQVAGSWSGHQRGGLVQPNTFKVRTIKKQGAAVTFVMTWHDPHQRHHAVSIDLVPMFRSDKKKFGDIWTPPLHFEDPHSPCNSMKASIQNTPLVLAYDPFKNGWTCIYLYTDTVIYDYLKLFLPDALTAFRLLKVLRDAKLPWKCKVNAESKEITGVVPWFGSIILQSSLFYEVLENCAPEAWGRDQLPERLMSMTRRLLALTNYRCRDWVTASSFLLLPHAEKTGNKLHPTSKAVKQLLDTLYERKRCYESGTVVAEEECGCCCHGVGHHAAAQAPHDVHDKQLECLVRWNPHCVIDFREPVINKMCSSSLCGHKSSNGATVRMTQRGLLNLLKNSKQLVSEEHLNRYLPTRQLRVMAVTWNTGEALKVPHHLSEFLLYPQAHDLYVISLQESVVDRTRWEHEIPKRLGANYEILFSGNHGAMYTIILIRRDLFQFCSEPEDANVIVKPMYNWFTRTKGALGVHFTLFGTSFLFINSHLTPKGGKMTKRCEDFHEICEDLELPKDPNFRLGDLPMRFDCVFWLGDLNFRMLGGRGAWGNPHALPDCEQLLENYDELTIAQGRGEAFVGFKEGYISFHPSFRFARGTDMYEQKDNAENPTYADRILYHHKSSTAVRCSHYNNVLSVRASDHKPVHGSYEVSIKA